jgi:hypothetical protein
MVPFFPRQVTNRAILTYTVAFILVQIMYLQYAMLPIYVVIGFLSVFGFFLFSSRWTQDWKTKSERYFVRDVFIIAITLRLIWVVFSYFYFTDATGTPFEFSAADSIGYHQTALWLYRNPWSTAFNYFFGPESPGVSDSGYALYLTLVYKIFGPNIIIARILKAILSAVTCILVYRIAKNTFGESIARMALIMCALMPNLIFYCGYHLKETEMVFMEVWFLERADHVLREKRFYFYKLILPTLLALSLFLFRTVLGAAAVFAFASAVLFSNSPLMRKNQRRLAFVGWGFLCLVFLGGGIISTEAEGLWAERDDNVAKKRLEQTLRGNRWAHYATGTVMLPMIYVLPFSTMVNVDQQYGQQEKHGGNYIRNFMGIFTLLGIYEAFRRRKWRDFTLIGAFVVSYLVVIASSGFSNSERFLLPGLPCLILIWAYGIATLRKETFKLLNPWCIVVVLMEVAWAYFKLGSRGLF